MKKLWIIPLFALWLLAVHELAQGKIADEQDVTEVFSAIGNTDQQTSVVEYYGEYKKGYLNQSQRKSYLKQIAEELGITEGAEIASTYDDGRIETKLLKVTNIATTTLRLITTEADGETKQYIIANLTFQGGMDQALAYRKKLDRFLEPDTKDSKSSANIIGSYDGELSMKKRDQIADRLLTQLDARVVTENREEKLYTIYGYTSRLNEYKMQGDEAVNINIAMYYSPSKDETFVYAAIPVLGLDY